MAQPSSLRSRPSPLPEGSVVEGYQIERKLAAGGFGVVYLARDPQGGKVAIKEYLPTALSKRRPGELEPRPVDGKEALYKLGLRSFFEEGRALAQISSPSVVSVLNFFRANKTVYMVMNYVPGGTLQEFVVAARGLRTRNGPVLQELTIRSLFDEILNGLRVVHKHRMLHLDVKPSNILIGEDNRSVLIDFGASRQVLSTEGELIRPMYTPGFAAPEMYRRAQDLGPWTDIYAVGACIYACMAGVPPHDVSKRQDRDRLDLSLSRMNDRYSSNLIDVVEWCMSLDALTRPQSVFSLQRELARGLAPVQPPGLWARVRARLGHPL